MPALSRATILASYQVKFAHPGRERCRHPEVFITRQSANMSATIQPGKLKLYRRPLAPLGARTLLAAAVALAFRNDLLGFGAAVGGERFADIGLLAGEMPLLVAAGVTCRPCGAG
jgi:hypothetical protein